MPLLRTLTTRRLVTSLHVATAAVALLLAAAALVAYDVGTIHDRSIRVLTAEAQMVGYNAVPALMAGDRDAAAAILKTLRADPEVLAAGIFKPDGVAFVTYFRDDPSVAAGLVNAAPGDGHKLIGKHLLVYRTITRDGVTIASIRLLSGMQEVTASVLRHLAAVVVVFIVVVGASLPILSRLHRRISGPIADVASKARIVSEQKDYSVRATASEDDEIGVLVRSFNEMLSQIQKRDQARDRELETARHRPATIDPRAELERARSARAAEVVERNVRSQAQLIEALLEVVESLRATADRKGVRLQLAVDPRAIVIAVDPQGLKQLLWKLLSNAIELTPAGGRVQVGVRRMESHVEISVSDVDGGIDPVSFRYVFDRVPAAAMPIEGAGGGESSTVRELVELHGGRVRIDGIGEGHGATCTVELPIAVVEETPTEPVAQAVPAPAPHVSLAGLRVLAVDDDSDALGTVRDVLEQRGVEVRTATSEKIALETLDEWLPNLLIFATDMPAEDGESLIHKVRARSPEGGGLIPALGLTASERIEDQLPVLPAGFRMHVTKPIDPLELIAVVTNLAHWGLAADSE